MVKHCTETPSKPLSEYTLDVRIWGVVRIMATSKRNAADRLRAMAMHMDIQREREGAVFTLYDMAVSTPSYRKYGYKRKTI